MQVQIDRRIPEVKEKPRVTWDIPVPPYDQPLPESYWQEVKPPQPPKSAKRKFNPYWISRTAWALLLIAMIWNHQQDQKNGWVEPVPNQNWRPPEQYRVVTPGRYTVNMPDGRRIIINYKGEVNSFSELPPQPKLANNAAYKDLSTGLTWIWTVPAGASNTAQWIDP